MKIVCSKEEFARLVRNCEHSTSSYPAGCSGCVFSTFCTQSGDASDDEIMTVIEDICEIGAEANG